MTSINRYQDYGRRLVDAAFARAGYTIFVRRKSADVVLFDRAELLSYAEEDHVRQLYETALAATGLEWSDNFSKRCRFASMAEVLRYALTAHVPGDVAECGCWKGTSTYMIASLLQASSFSDTFHVFDSFGGLSDLQAEDRRRNRPLTTTDIARQQAVFAGTESEVRQALAPFPFVQLHKGWIPERFSEVKGSVFRFVHIDVDLYQPTRDSLRFFYPRLNARGAIAFDDYGLTQFPGAKRAIDEFLAEETPTFFYRVPTGGAFLIK
jgi:O-methyltransferase